MRQATGGKYPKVSFISTHAPHARCDAAVGEGEEIPYSISTHAPHARCDAEYIDYAEQKLVFLLTHPMRGATNAIKVKVVARNTFLLTHPMRGATDFFSSAAGMTAFLLTHPMRGATFQMSK